MTALVRVSGESVAEKVLSAFHLCPVAGKPIECVRAQDFGRTGVGSREKCGVPGNQWMC